MSVAQDEAEPGTAGAIPRRYELAVRAQDGQR